MRRERLAKLQSGYGQALLWSKGLAAEEARTAFKRVADLAGPPPRQSRKPAEGPFIRGRSRPAGWTQALGRHVESLNSCGRRV